MDGLQKFDLLSFISSFTQGATARTVRITGCIWKIDWTYLKNKKKKGKRVNYKDVESNDFEMGTKRKDDLEAIDQGITAAIESNVVQHWMNGTFLRFYSPVVGKKWDSIMSFDIVSRHYTWTE